MDTPVVTPSTNLFKQAADLYKANQALLPVDWPLIFVAGESGTGKTASSRNLPPEQTAIINVEEKPLSFRGGDRWPYQFPNEKRKFGLVSDIDMTLDDCLKETCIKYLFFDSFTKYCELLRAHCKETKKSDKNTYAQWNMYNESIFAFLNKVKRCGKKMVIITGIPEILKDETVEGTVVRSRRISVGGKEWEGKIEKEFTLVLYTEVRKEATGVTYRLITNNDGTGSTSAKTPNGMFKDLRIENDLKLVCDTVQKFYGLEG